MATADLKSLMRLRAALAKPEEKPAGFRTADEFAEAWGLNRVTAAHYLIDGFRAGLWERRKWGRFYVWKEITK